jgi:hypothetical protein
MRSDFHLWTPPLAQVRIWDVLTPWSDAAICPAFDAPPWRRWPVWTFADRAHITHCVL